ncbi:MAG TPA: DUF72 domain-containing protein [Rhodopila sp.]|nr:DUF72 domain-containing protein [Rhodopila sp.]
MIRIGTAGWTIPKQHAAGFPADGTHLHRYARRMHAVEINSSFYRPHQPATYARWAASVPPDFRFAVKIPREITHVRKLVSATDVLDRFLSEVAALGDRRGPLLVQLPPSLRFDPSVAGAFFDAFRAHFDGLVVCEPRHASWFTAPAEALLSAHEIARAAADPAPAPVACRPGGWSGLEYRRLHGSPRMYYSAYSAERLDETANLMRLTANTAQESWCIFDNTALGEATSDAIGLWRRISRHDYGEGTGSDDE